MSEALRSASTTRLCRVCDLPFRPVNPTSRRCAACAAVEAERAGEHRRAARTDWSTLPLGITPDVEIAARTGLDAEAIGRARRRRGIPPAPRADRARASGAVVDEHTAYVDDVSCQLFVGAFPDGMSLEEIGDAMGVTRERIRQIETRALPKLGKRLALAGVSEADFRELMARRDRCT